MKNTFLLAAVIILVGVFSFFVGAKIRGTMLNRFNTRQFAPYMTRSPYQRYGHGMMQGYKMGNIQGQITKIDGNNITLQLSNGGTYIVTISDQTPIEKASKGSKSDLKEGQNLTVFGGSYPNEAQRITIIP